MQQFNSIPLYLATNAYRNDHISPDYVNLHQMTILSGQLAIYSYLIYLISTRLYGFKYS